MIKRKGIARKHPLRRSKLTSKRRKRRKRSPLTLAKENLEETQKKLTILLYGRDCYTCPQKNLEGQNCQLGHVPYPRADLSVKFIYDIRLTRIQCFRCNIHLGGAGAVALDRMMKEGFDPRPLKEESDSQKGKSVPTQWFLDQKEKYQKQIQELSPQ